MTVPRKIYKLLVRQIHKNNMTSYETIIRVIEELARIDIVGFEYCGEVGLQEDTVINGKDIELTKDFGDGLGLFWETNTGVFRSERSAVKGYKELVRQELAGQPTNKSQPFLAQAKGSFREPYNPASIFSRLGISWWADVLPLCTPSGALEGKNLRKLKKMVAHAPLQMATQEEFELLWKDMFLNEWKGFEECDDFVKAQHKELLAFLTSVIRRKGAIYCTLEPALAANEQQVPQQPLAR